MSNSTRLLISAISGNGSVYMQVATMIGPDKLAKMVRKANRRKRRD